MKPIGIALGGGGAKGLAHIGVLKALKQLGIEPTVVAGTSMGAMVGAVYAALGSVEETEKRFHEMIKWDGFKKNEFVKTFGETDLSILDEIQNFIKDALGRINFLTSKAYYRGEGFRELIEYYFDTNDRIESFHFPFAAVSTDLLSGTTVSFERGQVIPAVQASASITGLMPPQKFKSYLLTDGEVTDLVPIRILNPQALSLTIAVDVAGTSGSTKTIDNGLEIILRKGDILSTQLRKYLLEEADIAIVPDVDPFEWYDMEKISDIIAAGEKAVLDQRDHILNVMNKKRGWWNRLTDFGSRNEPVFDLKYGIWDEITPDYPTAPEILDKA